MVLIIGEKGTILRTPLMEKANMNSKRIKLYLNWLELNDLVKIEGQKITLTENGMKFRLRYLQQIEV